MWAIVGGFLIGVFARSFFALGLAFVGFAILLAFAMLALSLIETHKCASVVIMAVALIAFALGIVRMNMVVLTGDPALTSAVGSQVTLEGVVTQEPDARDKSTRVSVSTDTLITKYKKTDVRAGVLVEAPPHADIQYGDRVRAFGTLRLPQAFDTGLGRQFDYPSYLAVGGIGYELAFAQIERVTDDAGNFAGGGNILKSLAIHVKELYLRGEDAALPEPEAALAGGITVGDKRSVGPELTAVFQRDSLVHMIVLSGYNITVVLNTVARLLAWAPRIAQFGASGMVVVFFILMSGGASSAVRAGTMALLAVLARATGRLYLAGRVLGVVAFAMVLWNPWTLAFDPSFQLSALATLGLIAFTPVFAARLQWLTEKFGLREIAASTLATQSTVLPLLLYQNGTLSLVALPANLLALAPVPFAMLFSFIAALGGMALGAYAAPLAFPAFILLGYIIAVARFFSALPFAAVSISTFSAWWVFAAYALMFGGLWIYKKRRPVQSPAA